MTKISERITELRKEHGIDSKTLSERIKVSASAVSRWENSICIPDGYAIIKLAKFFGVSAQYLIGLEEDYNSVEAAKNRCGDIYKLDKRLKQLRIKGNFTQKYVGDHIKVAGQSVSRWESKIHIPSAEDIKGLARFFDVRADYLLGIED